MPQDPEDEPQDETTVLLRRWREGDENAYEAAFERVYDELRRTAKGLLRSRRQSSLQPTALVHDAYLRLVDQTRATFADRQHFVAIAATVMRRLLIDHVRARGAAKRGGESEHVPFEEAWLKAEQREGLLVEVDDALSELERSKPDLAALVELKFFAGFSLPEIAESQGLSLMTTRRRWKQAKEWLHEELNQSCAERRSSGAIP